MSDIPQCPRCLKYTDDIHTCTPPVSDIQQKEHQDWWRGYSVGFDAGLDAVKRAYDENSKMPLRDVILRMKVAKMTRIPEVKDE